MPATLMDAQQKTSADAVHGAAPRCRRRRDAAYAMPRKLCGGELCADAPRYEAKGAICLMRALCALNRPP